MNGPKQAILIDGYRDGERINLYGQDLAGMVMWTPDGPRNYRPRNYNSEGVDYFLMVSESIADDSIEDRVNAIRVR